jgi:hypothetical protein
MAASSLAPRLTDIIEAIEHIRSEMAGVTIEAFEADWRKRWLVERGVEIISEASRHLTDELKSRHPEIPLGKGGWYRKCSSPRIRRRCAAGHAEARAGRSDPIGGGVPRRTGE